MHRSTSNWVPDNAKLLVRHACCISVAALSCVVLLGCERPRGRASDSDAYTLYRTGSLTPSLRIRVASFDEPDDETYNRNTCEEVRALQQASVAHAPQPPRYWCEKGYWRE